MTLFADSFLGLENIVGSCYVVFKTLENIERRINKIFPTGQRFWQTDIDIQFSHQEVECSTFPNF